MKRAMCSTVLVFLLSVGFTRGQATDKSAPPNAVPAPGNGSPYHAHHGLPPDPLGPAPWANGDCGGCGPCGGCNGGCPEDFFWAEAEFLAWWVKNGPLPGPLVSIGSPTDPIPGAVGQPGTVAVFGNDNLDFHTFSGGRWTVGFWATCDHIIGFDVSGFLLENRSDDFAIASDTVGRPLIARPFVNALTGAEGAFLVTSPGVAAGTVSTAADSRLWGLEANARTCVVRECDRWFDVIAGFRYANLNEGFSIASNSIRLTDAPFVFGGVPSMGAGTLITATDQFSAINRFYGGQIGAQGEYCWGGAYVNATGKLAIGTNSETVTVAGSSALTAPGGGATTVGSGLLAVTSNSGTTSSNRFAVVPELRLRAGYHFNQFVSAYVGYTFLYWSDVVRPGAQIDRVINPTLVAADPAFGGIAGPSRPARLFEQSDFWAQGLDFGIAISY